MDLRVKVGQVAKASTVMSRRNIALAVAALAIMVPLLWTLRAPPVSVDVAPVTRGPMQVTVDEEGKARVRQVYTVSAPVTGKLRRSLLDPGDVVVRNETVVAVIEPTAPLFLDARTRAEAEAQLTAARAAVALAEAEVKQAESELGWTASELQRTRALAQTNVVSARAFERARLEHDKQQAALARAKANREVRMAELSTAMARLIGPESVQDVPGSGHGCCVEVRSPQSGKVLKELQESERVIVAGTPLFEIGDPADLELIVELLSMDAVRVKPGASAMIEGAGLTAPFTAKVRRVEPSGFTKVSALGIEEQRVRVYLDITAPANVWTSLGHDYRIFARIVVWRSESAVRVPLSALFRQGSDWAVYVVAADRAQRRAVEIGQRNNEYAEVVKGLSVGDEVVLHPSDRVSDGLRLERRTNGP